MSKFDEQSRRLDRICEDWEEITKIPGEHLYMNHGPVTKSVFLRSKARLAQFSPSESDDQIISNGYQKISNQLKLAGKRKFDISKFALLGCFILIALHGLRYYEARKSHSKTSNITLEKAEFYLNRDRKYLAESLKETRAKLEAGKEELATHSEFKKHPEKLDRYWEILNRYEKEDSEELALIQNMNAEEYKAYLSENSKHSTDDVFWTFVAVCLLLPLYIASTATPVFLIWKRNKYSRFVKKGMNSVGYILGGGILMSILGVGGSTEKYLVRWSDGSVTEEQIGSNGGFVQILLILYLLMLSTLLIPLRIIVGFLRNRVLYF